MITARDSDFHASDPSNWSWTETTPLIFSVPEARILGNLYIAARPNLGVALSSVAIAQGFCRHPYEIDFCDAQMHLPCPKSFTKYKLENGLSVEVTRAPTEYRFLYEYKLGGCSLDPSFRSLHEPFDALDPAHNPVLKDATGHKFDERLGDQWGNPNVDTRFPSGHYEMMGHITGELELRGRRYKVDCYDVMDHSFGKRTEVSRRAVSFMSAVFGEDYGIHLAVPLEVRNGETVYEGFRFGYVMEAGKLFGITHASIESSGNGMQPMNCRAVATDVRGKTHEL